MPAVDHAGVEHAQHAGVRHRRDLGHDRGAEPLQGGDGVLAAGRVPAPGREHEQQHLAARVQEPGHDSELVGRRGGDLRVPAQHAAGLAEGEQDQAGQHLRERVQPVPGGGDDAEGAAAAAQRPVQVGVAGVAGGDVPPVGQDDVGAEEVVQRQAVPAAQRPVPAGQGEAGHADRLDRAGDRGEPVTRRGRGHVAGGGAALGDRGAGGGGGRDGAHRGQVEHHAAVAQRPAGPVVAAAAHRQRQAVLAGGADSRRDVLVVRAAGDQGRAVPDRAVPDLPRGVVGRVGGGQHGATQGGAEPAGRRGGRGQLCRGGHWSSKNRATVVNS